MHGNYRITKLLTHTDVNKFVMKAYLFAISLSGNTLHLDTSKIVTFNLMGAFLSIKWPVFEG